MNIDIDNRGGKIESTKGSEESLSIREIYTQLELLIPTQIRYYQIMQNCGQWLNISWEWFWTNRNWIRLRGGVDIQGEQIHHHGLIQIASAIPE